jgi:serine protease Do
MGLSFAIPVEVAMDVIDQIKSTGYVSRGWLGVYIQEVTRELAQSFGMDKPSGALVAKIMDDSPAIEAKIKVGDVIIKFNGQEITSSASLPPIVGRVRVGEKVPVEILRNGKIKKVNVVIGQLPDSEQAQQQSKTQTQKNGVLGMKLQVLDDDEREKTGLDFGLRVIGIQDGPAKAAGVRKNDVVQMIDGEKVDSIKSLKKLIKDLPAGKYVSVLVQRPEGPQFLAMQIPANSEQK